MPLEVFSVAEVLAPEDIAEETRRLWSRFAWISQKPFTAS